VQQRQQNKRQDAETKFAQDQVLAERQADADARQAKAQESERLQLANKQRYFGNLFSAARSREEADRIASAAEAHGVSVRGGPLRAGAAGPGMPLDSQAVSRDLMAESSAHLGAPKPEEAPHDRTTDDIVEFERSRPELIGTPQYGPELEKWIRYRAASKSGGDDPAGRLRKEFMGLPIYKETQTLATAHQKVMGASSSGAGDIGLIFGYMKMLDPNSTVREGEFATAEEAGGIPSRILNLYNKAISGQRLPDSVRTEFRGEANNIFGIQKRRFDVAAKEFSRLARGAGASPRDVVLNSGFGGPPTDTDIDAAFDSAFPENP
jgi:hypothetical protein